MELLPERLYHLYNRGNNGQQVFFSSEHYLYFLRKLRTAAHGKVEVLAWCLMPNHFHLLIWVPPTPEGRASDFNRHLAIALSSYTRGLNKERNETGSRFQARTKAKLISVLSGDSLPYALTCFHYIHQNALRAGLAASLEAWPWSSYRDYAGLRPGTLCAQARARELLQLPSSSEGFQLESQQAVDVERLRTYLRT